MTLLEGDQRRSRRAQRKHQKQQKRKHKPRPSALAAPLTATALHDNQVLSFVQWCGLNHISERTGRRILASGNGPKVVQLSAKRIGITVGANRRWQESRERA